MKTIVLTLVEANPSDHLNYQPITETLVINAEDNIKDADVPVLLQKALQEHTKTTVFGELPDDSDDTDDIVYFGEDIRDVPEKILKKYGLAFSNCNTIQLEWETGNLF